MLTMVLVTLEKKYLSEDRSRDKEVLTRLPDKILKASKMSKIPSRATTVINATVSLWPVMIGLPILYEIWPVSPGTFYFFPVSTAHVLVSYEVTEMFEALPGSCGHIILSMRLQLWKWKVNNLRLTRTSLYSYLNLFMDKFCFEGINMFQ